MNQETKKEAYAIMNKALVKLYSIKELSSNDIVAILEEYLSNEKWQVEQDKIFNGDRR